MSKQPEIILPITPEQSHKDSTERDSSDYVSIPIKEAKNVGLPEQREINQEEEEHILGLMEAVLFLSPDPVPLVFLARHCGIDKTTARKLVDRLADDYAEREGGIELREIAGGYRLITSKRYGNALKEIFQETKQSKLSPAVMETLAVIAYQQPVTLPEIDDIRSTSSRTMISALLQNKLIQTQGCRPTPGRPTLYVTTKNFLSHFALYSTTELPPLSEVKELHLDEIK